MALDLFLSIRSIKAVAKIAGLLSCKCIIGGANLKIFPVGHQARIISCSLSPDNLSNLQRPVSTLCKAAITSAKWMKASSHLSVIASLGAIAIVWAFLVERS